MKASLCRERGLFLIANKLVSVITLIFFSAGTVFALPAGQQVVNGQASFITQSNNLMITSSPNAIINWQGFSINNNEAVRFIQQYSTSSVLNRVIGQDPSRILGLLQSNGRVFLINPNGILFGQGARIDVNGLFASTLAISNQDFLAGRFNFSAGAIAGSIQNQGTITTPEGGKVYLIAPDIENSGIINSPQGEVLLAAGHSVQLVDSLNPDIAVVVSAPENKAVNLGQIVAQSGKVGIYGGLISQKGIVNADSAVVGENGRIFFKASKDVTLDQGSTVSAKGGNIQILGDMESGTVRVSGTIDASAPNGGDGGFIETSAAHVKVDDSARITTLAPYGRAGMWLLDPYDFTIAASGGDISGTALSTALGSNSVTIQTLAGSVSCTGATCGTGTISGNGDIFVNDTVSWSAYTLTLSAYRNIYINSVLNGSGAAKLALEYGQGALNAGNTATYSVNAPVNLPTGPNFSTKLGSDGTPVNFTVITSLGAAGDDGIGTQTLQGIAYTGNLAGNYALGSNIDASTTSGWNTGAGFVPVGVSGTPFSGTFDGLGHTITGVKINRSSMNYVGLFGYNTGVVKNVGIVNGTITGGSNVGGLVGYNDSTGRISNSYSTSAVSGTTVNTPRYVGGLVGYNNTGTISNSYSGGTVSGTTTGSVGTTYVGGLVGYGYGGISNSYSTSAVSGASGASADTYVGGLVGYNGIGTISNAYSTGTVTGTAGYTTYNGGLLGGNVGTITNSYWDTETSGRSNCVGTGSSGGCTGLADWNMMQSMYFSGFDFTSGTPVWRIYNGYTYPLLRSFLTPATVTANNDSKTYNGLAYTGGNGVTCSTGSCGDDANYQGAVGYDGTSQGAINAGSYTLIPYGYYSNQQGYDITFGNGALTVNKAALTVTANPASKTYNGLAYTGGNGVGYTGFVNGETATVLGGTLAYGGTSQGASNAGSYVITPSGLTSGNYAFTFGNGALTVNKAALTITAVTNTKTYDGGVTAAATPTVAGIQSEDTVTGLAEAYADKNAGTGKTLNVSAYTVNDGNSGANYTVTTVADTTGVITKAPLTITAATNTKTYDGGVTAAATPTVAGIQSGDTVTGLAEVYANKNAGTGKTLNVSAYTVNDGNSGANYTVSTVAGTTGVINKASLTITAATNTKGYDGNTSAAALPTITGLAGTDTATSSEAYDSKIAGTGKTLTPAAAVISDGNGGNNYLVTYVPNTTGVIEPGQIVSGMLDVAAGGKTIYFVVNGTLLSDSASTTESGNYSAIFPLIPNNSALLAYVANDSSVKSASVYLSTGGDITNLLLSSNTVTAGGGGTMSNATFGTAKGALSSSDIPYSVSGTNLTLSPGFNFKTASGTTYKIDGNITTTNGAHTYNGPVTLLGHAVLSSGTGNISFGGAVTGTGYNFTLNSQGTVTQTAPISVSGLELLGTGGTYNLTDAGNAVTTLAGNTGTVNFKNSTGLSIDTVNTTTGMTTSGSVALNATGAIGLNGDVLAAGGIEIHAAGDGDVRQYAGNIANTIAGSTTPGGYDINISGHDVNLRSVASQRDIDVTAQSLTVGNVQALGLQGFHVDDEYFTYLLPFSFSFYGTPYTTAYISSNGIITFGSGTSAYTDSTSSLQNYKIIASAWNDWDTRDNSNFTRPLDVYVSSAAGALGVRWDVARYPRTSQSAQFETVLYNNGNIKFNYGPANYSFSGDVTIGLSNQSSASTLASQLMSQPNFSMNNLQSTTFSYASEAGGYSETLSTGSDWNASMTGSGTSSITSLGNITLNSAAGIAINGAVNAGSNKLKLVGAGIVSQMAPITAAGLELLGAGATYNLTNTDNAITTLAGNTGTVNFTNSTGIGIGTVNTAGLATSGDLTLKSGGAITQSAPLQVVGVATFDAGATNDITLTDAGNSFSSVGITSGKDVSLTNTGALVLNASTASNNLSATAGGDITLNGLVTATGAGTEAGTGGNVTLHSGGAIINGMGSSTSISAGSLFAEAVNGIGSGDPLMTGVNNVTALNTTANNIEIDNTGVLTVSDLKNLGTGNVILQNIGGITTETSPVTASGGSVSMTAHSPLTIGSGGVTASGSISLEASSSEGGSDNLTINGSIASANGSIILTAGSDIVLGPGGTLSAPNGTITLNGTSSTGAGDLAVTGNETATDNTVSSLEKGDDEDERRKKIRERGEQTSDDKKTDDVKKYCN